MSNLTPPYVSYRTFRTFLEFLSGNMPDRIDRSVWGERFSGSSGVQLISALRFLNLMDQDNKPTPELEEYAPAMGKERRRLLQKVLYRSYKPLFEIELSRATKAQFKEAFKKFGVPEKLQVKCEAFFVQAAQDAGIELSKFILKGRHSISTPPTQPPRIEPVNTDVVNVKLEIASMILNKYPDFDASWDVEVQKQWMIGLKSLYDGLI